MFYYMRHHAYARDHFECQLCHKDLRFEDRNPPIHHIDGDIHNNKLPNLVTLCPKCHSKIHATYSAEQLDTFNFHQIFKVKRVEIKPEARYKPQEPFLFSNI